MDGGKEQARAALVVVQEVVPTIAGTDSHDRHVFAHLHLVLQSMSLHILFQQTVLRCCIQGRTVVLAQADGQGRDLTLTHIAQICRNADADFLVGLADVLGEQLRKGGQCILGLYLLALQFALAQLYLQQVVSVDSAHTNTGGNVFLQLHQHLMDGSESLQFLLDRHHLPVILLSGHLHLIFGGFKLNFTGLYSYLRQFVAVNNLSTHEYRLDGRDGAQDAILDHLEF